MILSEAQIQQLVEFYRAEKEKTPLFIDLYKKLIDEYLRYKERTANYRLWYTDSMSNEYEYIVCLSDEERADIDAIMDRYIEDEYPEEAASGGKENMEWRRELMPEIIDRLEGKRYYQCERVVGDMMLLSDIDPYFKCYIYKFRLAVFENGIDSAPTMRYTMQYVHEDHYKMLLYRCLIDCNTTIQRLRITEPNLFNSIMDNIEGNCFDGFRMPSSIPIYAIDFVEAREDAEVLRTIIERGEQ